jgi:hypothetical protein
MRYSVPPSALVIDFAATRIDSRSLSMSRRERDADLDQLVETLQEVAGIRRTLQGAAERCRFR